MDRAVTSFLKIVLTRKTRNSSDGDDDDKAKSGGWPSATACQIVVLGSGKDASYFRLRARTLHGLQESGDEKASGDSSLPLLQSIAAASIRWYDVDHDAVLQDKAAAIEREPAVFFQLSVVRRSENCFECTSNVPSTASARTAGRERYFLLSFDLRRDVLQLRDELLRHEFDCGVPTLFVSECFQMYLPEESTVPLLRGIVAMMEPRNCYLSMYEPILGRDSFGRVMESNLLEARMVQPGSCLVQTRSLSQYLSKLRAAGFRRAAGCDLWTAYETVVTPRQRQRANRSEFLDELEEWILIMQHYCLVVASSDGDCDGATFCSVGATSPMGFATGRCEWF
jgi:O-methyltransferase involved in polyketide biosynthesis